MGTTTVSIHIYGGDEREIRALLPNAAAGKWSRNYVSVYASDFARHHEKAARTFSRKVQKPVLFAALYDSDVFDLIALMDGQEITRHTLDEIWGSKLGNVARFCEMFGLPPEDAARLKVIWKKGDAEEQMELTAMLFGAPLFFDSETLPSDLIERDEVAVDQWIAEHPAPPKVTSETKCELLQTLPEFRLEQDIRQPHGPPFLWSEEPYDQNHVFPSGQLWACESDGTYEPIYESKQSMFYTAGLNRIVATAIDAETKERTIAFDSEGQLPKAPFAGNCVRTLPNGDTLWWGLGTKPYDETILCRAPDGTERWRRTENKLTNRWDLGLTDAPYLLLESADDRWLERVDAATGATIDRIPRPYKRNVLDRVYRNGITWVSHFRGRESASDKPWAECLLTRLDASLRPVAEVPTPRFTEHLYLSDDGAHLYAFVFKESVRVLSADTLALENTLIDKTVLLPLGFDAAGRFWLKRDESTVEAWDALLTAPRSRHRLKGSAIHGVLNKAGEMCVSAWHQKDGILRVYRLA